MEDKKEMKSDEMDNIREQLVASIPVEVLNKYKEQLQQLTPTQRQKQEMKILIEEIFDDAVPTINMINSNDIPSFWMNSGIKILRIFAIKSQTERSKIKYPLHFLLSEGRRFSFILGILNGLSDVNEKDHDGQPLLHRAVIMKDVAAVQFLLMNGVNLEASNAQGQSARHTIASMDMDETASAILGALHFNGAKRCKFILRGKTGCFNGCAKYCHFNGSSSLDTPGLFWPFKEVTTVNMDAEVKAKDNFVLSIDGGSVLGLNELKMLQMIEDAAKIQVRDLFEIFTGCSSGGVIVLCIVAGLPVKLIESLFYEFAIGGLSLLDAAKASSMLDRLASYYIGNKCVKDVKDKKFIVPITKAARSTGIPFKILNFGYNYERNLLEGPINLSETFECDVKNMSLSSIALKTGAAFSVMNPHQDDVDGGFLSNFPLNTAINTLVAECKEVPHMLTLGAGMRPSTPVDVQQVYSLATPIESVWNWPYLKKPAEFIVNCVTACDGNPVDIAATTAKTNDKILVRLNPKLSVNVNINCSEITQLVQVQYETYCFMKSNGASIKRLTEIIAQNKRHG